MEASSNEVTALLSRLAGGDKSVIERLMPLVYAELHRRANQSMRQERADHTLQPTALVHEVYLKLVQQREPNFKNRAHFYAIAAQLMRRILTDHARARLAAKRGGAGEGEVLMDVRAIRTDQPAGVIAVNDALKELSVRDERQEKIVEMRFFGGLTVEETAEVLGISVRTVEREWSMARAWLYTRLKARTQTI
ncbi:MAG: sigma-70 family RNA polymerase sigma factor [Acidobacteriota bacterium]|nr:sigma-70 family RNA polymerase sigma factor [Acidobacteriota bacterium]MDE3163826.1 sigma-70 family RNA polymerase sigma factor [Acidobacteriota bacterium]